MDLVELLLNSDSFESFKTAVVADKAAADNAAKIAAESAANIAEDVAAFDVTNISPEMVVELGITNGMPNCLILQKYAEWKTARG